MSSIIDAESILMENEHWSRLDEEWGIPVDLEADTEDDFKLRPVFSSLDLIGSTFDSSVLLKKIRKKVGRKVSKRSSSVLDYTEFLDDLKKNCNMESSNNFYVVNSEIITAASVEKICKEIDDVFKSIEKLSSATSTLRKGQKFPEVVQCSISIDDLSFDDTKKSSVYNSEIDRHIEEALDQFGSTISSIEKIDQSTLASVTALVQKFSSVLRSPVVTYNWSPKKKRQCCDKFKELIDFWNKRAVDA
ncbi:uncharacterized protein LOC121731693 [Aricia agestis]|uniref:uncharacterized protein LOC121731693 n=1 Tax=Aricia agestis TaxID=91739 RepID=UPI001C206B21|nr:uncharacterized protein LOC121731693 [Aricia agestis]